MKGGGLRTAGPRRSRWGESGVGGTCDAGRREALELGVLVKPVAHHPAARADLWPRDVLRGAHHVPERLRSPPTSTPPVHARHPSANLHMYIAKVLAFSYGLPPAYIGTGTGIFSNTLVLLEAGSGGCCHGIAGLAWTSSRQAAVASMPPKASKDHQQQPDALGQVTGT